MSRPAPSWFRRRVRAIDSDLDVQWGEREQRWLIVQKLQNTPSVETLTTNMATEAQKKLADQGYVIDRPVLEQTLYPLVSRQSIVLRIEDEDGTPREPDERTLATLRRMAWKTRHRSAQDWIDAANELQYEADRQRRRAEADLWSYLGRDQTFKRILGDLVWGLRMKHTVGGPLPTAA